MKKTTAATSQVLPSSTFFNQLEAHLGVGKDAGAKHTTSQVLPIIQGLARRAAKVGVEPDDIGQEALQRMLTSACTENYRPSEGNPAQFASGIVRRTGLELARDQSRRCSVESGWMGGGGSEAESSIVNGLIKEEERHLVLEAINRLSWSDQLAIRNRYWAVTGCRAMTSTERAKLSRAQKRLRVLLVGG